MHNTVKTSDGICSVGINVSYNCFPFHAASNIPVLKEVEASMDPAAFTVVRFAVSAIPFIPFVLRARGDAQTRNAGIELGFWVSLGYLMQALGLLTSDAGRASFISMFTVRQLHQDSLSLTLPLSESLVLIGSSQR